MPLLEHLGRTVEGVTEVVPACLGLSIVRIDQRDSFTIAVSDETVAVLEGVQYLDGGPELDAASSQHWGEVSLGSLNGRWPLYTAASVRAGVRSTLTLPVTDNELHARRGARVRRARGCLRRMCRRGRSPRRGR